MNNQYATGTTYRRRKRKGRRFKPARFIVFVCIIIAAYLLFINIKKQGEQVGFCEGISINGIELAGMSYEEGLKLVSERLDERINNITYTIKYGEDSWSITGRKLGAEVDRPVEELVQSAWTYGHTGNWFERRSQIQSVREEPISFESNIEFDQELIKTMTKNLKSRVDKEPVDAKVVQTGRGQFEITPSSVGYTIDEAQLEEQLLTAIRDGTQKEINIVPEEILPKVTKEDLTGTVDKIADFSTSLKNSSSDRTSNVKLALSFFDNLVVEPGEQVSFNAVVGPRSEARGFKPAPEYAGDKVIEGIGGGVCQASTTLYDAILLAGLKPIKRSNHSMTVGYVDYSLDAAVSEQGKDLVFENNTPYRIYIFAGVDDKKKTARVTIFGKANQYRIELDSIPSEVIEPDDIDTIYDHEGKYVTFRDEGIVYKTGKPGVKSKGYRVYYDRVTGEEVKRELLSSDTYSARKPVYIEGVQDRDALIEY